MISCDKFAFYLRIVTERAGTHWIEQPLAIALCHASLPTKKINYWWEVMQLLYMINWSKLSMTNKFKFAPNLRIRIYYNACPDPIVAVPISNLIRLENNRKEKNKNNSTWLWHEGRHGITCKQPWVRPCTVEKLTPYMYAIYLWLGRWQE